MAQLSLSFSPTSQWSGVFEGTLQITNTGSTTLNDWSLVFSSPFELRSVSDFTLNQQQQADGSWRITLTPPNWGGALAPGSSSSSYAQGLIPGGGLLPDLAETASLLSSDGSGTPPVEPGPVDPAPVDPAPADPDPVDPAPVDPAPVDPTPVDPLPPTSGSGDSGLWSGSFYAPYVDMTLYPVPDLDGLARANGVGMFTLGFLQATQDGTPAWAGLPALSLDSSNEQAIAIRREIEQLRAAGGDVMVSLGGASGISLSQSAAASGRSAAELADTYVAIVDALGLKAIDFDIEGAAVADPVANALNSEALALMQAARPDVATWYTLPVLPQGLTLDGLNVVEAALQAGVRLDGVNVMAMNYGDIVAPPGLQSQGEYAIDAAESTFAQMSELFGRYGQSFGWDQMGVTPMIGVNDVTSHIFTPADAQLVEDFARQQGLGMLSMWSMARDTPGPIGQVSPVHSGQDAAAGSFAAIWEDYGIDPVISGGGGDTPGGDPGTGGGPADPADPVTNPGGGGEQLVEIGGASLRLTAQAGVAERFRPSYAWGRDLVIEGFLPGEDVLDLTGFWAEGQQARVLQTPDGAMVDLPFNQQTISLPGVNASALDGGSLVIWGV
ncbi:glycosyl hydrolase family 18 protein [Synechococcus sp. RSCCF101]|uniref:cellulose binding domain-containing protein n=1 Tax=Synechococcus sp. RSCCF101 TaxID=2511069 RepID=UPI00177DBC73|nr:glycosyl hydrolase family 18 protein [Synechococcus sp. RSCCF101]